MVRSRFLPHVLFWTLFLGLNAVYSTMSHNQGVLTWRGYLAEFMGWETPAQIGRGMLTVYGSLWVFTRWTAPRLWQLPVVLAQIIGLGLLDATLTCGVHYLLLLLNPVSVPIPDPSEPNLVPGSLILSLLPFSVLTVMLAFIFKQTRDYRQREALLAEKTALELAFLKAQLNPHFLFNSLNNLYGLALTEPERTPDALLKVAELLRYMLYESSAERVALVQEVAYLSSYLALEKLRHEGEVYLDFTVEGSLEGLRVAPLLLICLVENACKHGVLHNPAQPVQVHLAASGQRVRFTTRNQVAVHHQALTGGVGLPALRRRLALLYPHRHQLTITKNPSSFCCTLELDTRPAN